MPAGRPRKPTAQKIRDGDQPCRISRNEPKPSPGGVGPAPLMLDDVGRKCWDRMVEILEPMGILTSADAEALAIYSSNFAYWITAREEVARDGMTVPTQFSFKPHPMLSVIARCESQMAKILSQFGMTPAARAALDLGGKEDDDNFDHWVKDGHTNPNGPTKAPQPGG